MNDIVARVTNRIIEKSTPHREKYLGHLERLASSANGRPLRSLLPMSNLAHDLAACDPGCREVLKEWKGANIAIISSYNDVLSAHEPYKAYPEVIRDEIRRVGGGVAQFAGGVPAMCDGVTQGMPGMDLSLMSRDVIAMSTVIALSHNVFDGALLLGVCDKIMPGLLMGALQYGHLPMILVPAGPMPPGLPNREKARARERFAMGELTEAEMLEVELKSYHSPGTCTFYGTANSNQLMAEMMGLHLPGASFVNANTPLREALTRAAARRILELTHLGDEYLPIGRIVSEKNIVNAMVGLLASGGSTNETMHLVAIARAAGVRIDWDDFDQLSKVVPQIVKIYPNGPGDINSFEAAGGMAVLIKELLKGGLLHPDVETVAGHGLEHYLKVPCLDQGGLTWKDGPDASLNQEVISSTGKPFSPHGGIKVLSGNLGRAIMKVSSLEHGEDTVVEAPAKVFDSQEELENAFHKGLLYEDHIAVVRFQGPRANGMPELHKLITFLSVVMNRGYQVGLVTDGRLSGASGKVPFAIHCTPEAVCGGLLAKVIDGDIIRIDARAGRLELRVPEDQLEKRDYATPRGLEDVRQGFGRQIFSPLRRNLLGAEEGATSIFTYSEEKGEVCPIITGKE